MLEKIPGHIKLIAAVAALLAGPVTVFSFILGGAVGGAIALVAIGFFFVILYMVAVRKYT
jgi:hypothetical protein